MRTKREKQIQSQLNEEPETLLTKTMWFVLCQVLMLTQVTLKAKELWSFLIV